ncbi:MAG: pseudouridine synthase [Anaerolineaceae bacterium]|nr:pseudouridine synthase [Anaerolineaceae bacterium]
MAEERVQKIMSAAGIASRRASEELISNGRVTVNGKQIHLGDKADPQRDRICVDGKPINADIKRIYIALNKPKGYLSDKDETHPMPTVFDLVDVPDLLYSVGRLDFESDGLILLTNDGELTNRLTHPRYKHEKEYEVFVIKVPDEEQLAIWRRGVVLEDGTRTQPAQVEIMRKSANGVWLRIIMHEGKKRQIRLTGSRIGLPVAEVHRVRIGSLRLGKLQAGEWRYLKQKEVEELMAYAGLKNPKAS